VIAFSSGALVEIVENGKTGYLVKDARAMAEAI
jgi:glycosyltransferase involved in cell wall biosynthesis